MNCEYCKTNPGQKATGVWKGFYDADTRQLVCWGCRALHYRNKFKTHEQTYSEMPVMAQAQQMNLNLNQH